MEVRKAALQAVAAVAAAVRELEEQQSASTAALTKEHAKELEVLALQSEHASQSLVEQHEEAMEQERVQSLQAMASVRAEPYALPASFVWSAASARTSADGGRDKRATAKPMAESGATVYSGHDFSHERSTLKGGVMAHESRLELRGNFLLINRIRFVTEQQLHLKQTSDLSRDPVASEHCSCRARTFTTVNDSQFSGYFANGHIIFMKIHFSKREYQN